MPREKLREMKSKEVVVERETRGAVETVIRSRKGDGMGCCEMLDVVSGWPRSCKAAKIGFFELEKYLFKLGPSVAGGFSMPAFSKASLL